MQVLCMVSTEDQADLCCPVCGRAYKVYCSRTGASECEKAVVLARDAIIEHHAGNLTADAHPSSAFNVPAWRGDAHTSAAAMLGGAPLARVQPQTDRSLGRE